MNSPQQSDTKNVIIALLLAGLVITIFQTFFAVPPADQTTIRQQALNGDALLPDAIAVKPLTLEEVLKNSPRVTIDSPGVTGSISLRGAQIDDLRLNRHQETIKDNSPQVTLFSPAKTAFPYYAQIGWKAVKNTVELPTGETLWTADRKILTPDAPVTLTWQNSTGVIFSITIGIDDNYLFSIKHYINNTGQQPIAVFPYAEIVRDGPPPKTSPTYQGPIAAFDEKLEEVKYKTLKDLKVFRHNGRGGWLGFSEHYWLAALIPSQGEMARFGFFNNDAATDKNAATFLVEKPIANPGDQQQTTSHLFAGAKNVEIIDAYQKQLNLPLFDRTINFGFLYFLAKPFFYALHYIYEFVGTFGIAIILLTAVVRLFLAPFAHKSFKSMARLKILQPQMQALQERHKDDRMKLSQEMMQLYKRERVNPVSGCLPILIQIPVFFALYKTFLVTLEMRHQPFTWVADLSAPDAYYLLNGFGSFGFDLPGFLQIGLWPILVALTSFISQQLNPKPADKTQALMIQFFPVIFLFIVAKLPAGLAVYWTFNNIFSIIQQQIIKRSMK